MDKSLFKDFKIIESICEFRFYPILDIHRLVSDFESNLLNIFEKKATETMVPRDAPPNIPRFVLSSKKRRVLEVGPTSAIYKSNHENLTNDEAIRHYQEKTGTIFRYLDSKKDIVKLESFNTANLVHYPLTNIDYPIENDILENFFKIERPIDFKAASFTIVRRNGNFVFTNAIDAYERREIKMSANEIKDKQSDGGMVRIPLSNLKIIERGLINNIIIKQASGLDISGKINDTFNEILRLTIDKIKNHANSFIFRMNNA